MSDEPETDGTVEIPNLCERMLVDTEETDDKGEQSLDGLNSLCVIPVPADMRWNSPGLSTSPLPMESLCSNAPSST